MLRMKPMDDDVEKFFEGTDKEFEIFESIIKHTLAIISEHEKQIELSDLK